MGRRGSTAWRLTRSPRGQSLDLGTVEFSSAVSGSVPQRDPVSPGRLATALCRKASAQRALPVGRCWVVHPPPELRVGLQAGARAPGKGPRSHAGQQLPNGIGPQRDAKQNPFTGAERTPANPVHLRWSQLRLHISQRKPGKKIKNIKGRISFCSALCAARGCDECAGDKGSRVCRMGGQEGVPAPLWSSQLAFTGFLLVFSSFFIIQEASNRPVCNK